MQLKKTKANQCYKTVCFFSTATYILELSVRHKLDDVSHGGLAGLRAQTSVVSVQELHGAEVGPAHPNNYDGHGQARGVDDGAACLIHVGDHSVSDDQQNKVLLWGDGNNRGSRSMAGRAQRVTDKQRTEKQFICFCSYMSCMK